MDQKEFHNAFMWLQNLELEGTADCGCKVALDDQENPAFFMCPMHDAAPDLLKALKAMQSAYGRLQDFISDMIENGRLTEGDIPDDYQAIVHQLLECNSADALTNETIKRLEVDHDTCDDRDTARVLHDG